VPNTAAIDQALIALLANDATLTAAAPGGIYRDIAPQKAATPFIIVSQMAHEDQYQLGAQAFEHVRYIVKAVDQSTTGSAAQTAASRIHTILQDSTLTATGYGSLLVQREERIAYVEPEDDSDRRWQHRGGMYYVMVETR
jgi:hypothetical protein